MPRLITLSRAARLVGVKRGALQKKIRAGELRTFEGEILLPDLLHAYPQTQVEDTTMLERVEQIMEQAVNKIVRPPDDLSDTDTLAARILALSQELARARHEARRYSGLVAAIKDKFQELAPEAGTTRDEAFSRLRDWFLQALEAAEPADEANEDILAKEAFLRVMAAQIRILPSGHEFFIEGSDSILEAGLRGGLALSYGCSNGNCGLCKAKVVSGQVKKICPHDYVLTDTEKGLGYILTCSNTAVTDVVLEADEALGARDIPNQEIDIRIKKVERPDDRVLILNTKTPRTNRLRFLAGQHLSLQVDGLPAVDCAIASCPCDDMNLQFHLPVVSGNPLTEYLLNNSRQNEVIRITGPHGEFVLNEESPRSLIFIACNAGFGPIKSLIEHAMALDIAEQIHFYWIVTSANSHYQGNLCRSWADALDNFHYTALATDTQSDVKDLLPNIVNDFDDLKHYDCYACIPGTQVETFEAALCGHGLPGKQLHMEPIR
jgi:CDP-4-dehydro-6-deoxyglucose reductase